MRNNKKRFDIRSLSFKLWCYFILFAALLIALIWLLQIYFMDSFYEDMKLRETKKMAQELIDEYKRNGKEAMSRKINEISSGTDSYIRVETGDGRVAILPEYNGYKQEYLYSPPIFASNLRAAPSQVYLSLFPTRTISC